MRDTLTALQGGGRVVRGQVSSSGGVVTGTGYLVTRIGAGNYTVSFLSPFRSSPTIAVTIVENNLRIASAYGATAGSFTVQVWTSAGTPWDSAFNFIAMEATG